MQKIDSSYLSAKIDYHSVITYMLEQTGDALEKNPALDRLLFPEDEEFLPTPREVYGTYKRVSLELLGRIKGNVNDASLDTSVEKKIEDEGTDLAATIAEDAGTLADVFDVLKNLQSNQLQPEGRRPLSIQPASDIRSVLPLVQKSKKKTIPASAQNQEVAAFAHHATNTYYTILSELLIVAKPPSLKDNMNAEFFIPHMFASFFPVRTRTWIDNSRRKFGYGALTS